MPSRGSRPRTPRSGIWTSTGASGPHTGGKHVSELALPASGAPQGDPDNDNYRPLGGQDRPATAFPGPRLPPELPPVARAPSADVHRAFAEAERYLDAAVHHVEAVAGPLVTYNRRELRDGLRALRHAYDLSTQQLRDPLRGYHAEGSAVLADQHAIQRAQAAAWSDISNERTEVGRMRAREERRLEETTAGARQQLEAIEARLLQAQAQRREALAEVARLQASGRELAEQLDIQRSQADLERRSHETQLQQQADAEQRRLSAAGVAHQRQLAERTRRAEIRLAAHLEQLAEKIETIGSDRGFGLRIGDRSQERLTEAAASTRREAAALKLGDERCPACGKRNRIPPVVRCGACHHTWKPTAPQGDR